MNSELHEHLSSEFSPFERILSEKFSPLDEIRDFLLPGHPQRARGRSNTQCQQQRVHIAAQEVSAWLCVSSMLTHSPWTPILLSMRLPTACNTPCMPPQSSCE